MAFCKSCGKQIEDGFALCVDCGAKLKAQGTENQVAEKNSIAETQVFDIKENPTDETQANGFPEEDIEKPLSSNKDAEEFKSKNTTTIIIVAIIAAAIIIGSVVFAFIIKGAKEDKDNDKNDKSVSATSEEITTVSTETTEETTITTEATTEETTVTTSATPKKTTPKPAPKPTKSEAEQQDDEADKNYVDDGDEVVYDQPGEETGEQPVYYDDDV